ncbi:MAG: glycosyltransferase [Pseudomonadota bacterium]
MTENQPFCLVIPAHNEEAVIARCLKTAARGAPSPDSMEIIVAANGCTDRTVEVAQKTAPQALILDLPTGSKTAAINAANHKATLYPRIYLDADVECDFQSLAAIAEALREPSVMAAAPGIQIDLSHGSWFIRTYYAAWMKQPFAKSGKGGAGCYGLSRAALEQVGEFPEIIGDDIWIHTRFSDDVKRVVDTDHEGRPVFSIVRPPATAWQQVKVEARRMHGNAIVRRDHPSPYFAKKGQGGLGAVLRSGASPEEAIVFCGVKALVRIEAKLSEWRGNSAKWTRDLSSRQ